MLDASNGEASIQRNELAALLGCVPSQINYVITSRFTPEQGYIVESRRGGGGFIRITRIKMDRCAAIMHTVNSLGDALSQETAKAIVLNLSAQELLTPEVTRVMLAAVFDNSYRKIPVILRDSVRSEILKQMLVNTL
jgi:transcriptional regulator CtsR